MPVSAASCVLAFVCIGLIVTMHFGQVTRFVMTRQSGAAISLPVFIHFLLYVIASFYARFDLSPNVFVKQGIRSSNQRLLDALDGCKSEMGISFMNGGGSQVGIRGQSVVWHDMWGSVRKMGEKW